MSLNHLSQNWGQVHYIPVRINGVDFTCALDSGAGDRIYLHRGRAIAAGIRPTNTYGRSGWLNSEMFTVDERTKATLVLGSLKRARSEEHTSELQSHLNLVCR